MVKETTKKKTATKKTAKKSTTKAAAKTKAKKTTKAKSTRKKTTKKKPVEQVEEVAQQQVQIPDSVSWQASEYIHHEKTNRTIHRYSAGFQLLSQGR